MRRRPRLSTTLSTYCPTLPTTSPSLPRTPTSLETDEKDRGEEDVQTKQKAEYMPITITSHPILEIRIPNRFDKLDAKEVFEELHVLKQKADDAATEPQHHQRHPEQARRAYQDRQVAHIPRV